jgi:SEC-C motif-containing protein
MTENINCPCCSGAKFSVCCEQIVAGTKFATTPLELMRSRYTAHAVKNMAHIIRTMRGKPLKMFDEEKTKDEWFELCDWKKLEIIDAPAIANDDTNGIVEFKAYYVLEGVEHVLHERSKFQKVQGKWYYILGLNKEAHKPRNKINTVQAVGRNDLCPCGSNKKYKKCCANNS